MQNFRKQRRKAGYGQQSYTKQVAYLLVRAIKRREWRRHRKERNEEHTC